MRASLRAISAAALRPLVFPGRYRVYRVLRLVLGDEPLPFTVPLRGGGKLTVNSRFWQHMFYLGEYEWEVRRFLTTRVKPSDIVFDLGASIGICTVPLALRVRHVYAFEGLKANYDLLVHNLAQNGLDNVTPIYAAIYDRLGTLDVPDCSGGNYSLASSATTTVAVPAITLDDFCVQHGIECIDLLKMDIEGSETRALRGAERLLSERRIKCILTEFNPLWLPRMGSSGAELYGIFERHNLRVRALTRFARLWPISKQKCLAAKLPITLVLTDS